MRLAPVAIPEISVVVPAWNEESSLPSLWARLAAVLPGTAWEVLLIDDGSEDGTEQVLRAIADPRLRAVMLRGHHGKSAALRAGLQRARGRIVVLMDADLQDLPEEIPVLLAALRDGELDLVQARREVRRDRRGKVFASRVFNAMCSLFSGLPLHDVNCGFKAMRRDVAARLRIGDGLHRFFPVLAHREGFRVGEVTVRHGPRAFGRSRYGFGRYLVGFSDLFTVVLAPRLLGAAAPTLGWASILLAVAAVGAFSVGALHDAPQAGTISLLATGGSLVALLAAVIGRAGLRPGRAAPDVPVRAEWHGPAAADADGVSA